jgi:tetratricopeptide (TPR) repeat protein
LDLQRSVGKRIKEAVNLYWVGTGFAHRGVSDGRPFAAMDRSIRIFQKLLADQSEAVTNTFKGQSAIWFGNYDEAEIYHSRAWELSKAREGTDFADQQTVTKVLAASSRMLGEIEMLRGDYKKALEWLDITAVHTANMDFGEEILPHFRVMAELERRQGNFDAAREWLQKSWTRAERGPYRLYNVDSYNILAEVEDSCGNKKAAIKAAQTAYQLAWCDGPPYAYQRGLDDAATKLQTLNAVLPLMPAYDYSAFEPVPAVEINPQDEFFE